MNPERGGAIYPRISREMMRNFVNQYATIVGVVQNLSGTKLTISTSDKTTIVVENFKPDSEDEVDPKVIEVRGTVTGASTIRMDDYNSFGDFSFDLDTYNQMLNYYHSDNYKAMTIN